MINKDTSWVISLEDMGSYIHIKTEEDYTYEEAMALLKDGSYRDAPFSFLVFIARMVEISIISVYPHVTIPGDKEGKLYARNRNGKKSFPMYVRYKLGYGEAKVNNYETDYIYTDLDKEVLDEFIQVYQERVIHRIIDEPIKWEEYELESDLFETIRWVAMYFEHMTEVAWEYTMRWRVDEFLQQLNDYAKLKGANYPEELAELLIRTYRVEKRQRVF